MATNNHTNQSKAGKKSKPIISSKPITKSSAGKAQPNTANIDEPKKSKPIMPSKPITKSANSIQHPNTANIDEPEKSKPFMPSNPIKKSANSIQQPNTANIDEPKKSKPIMPSKKIKVQTTAPWLGEIPAHWEVTRLGVILESVSIKNQTDFPLLSITREKGVILRDLDDEEENHNFIPDDLSNYKVIRKGQFGMNKMKAWQGSYGVSSYEGIVSPAYYVFNLDENIVPEYFHCAIRSKLYISFFGSASDGVRIGQWDLSKNRMKEIPFLIPPLAEQTAIAQFLDRKTALIDQAIGIKQQQIALLQERRQILIHRAVTRGLNPNAPLKPSGVEWIGDIPEGWEVKRLKYISEVQSGVTLGKMYNQKNLPSYPYLRVANVQSGYFKLDEMAEISLPENVAKKYFVKKGDILVTEGGDLDKLGRGTVWKGEIKNCLHQNHIFAIRVNQSFSSPEYASMIMESDYGRRYFTNTANKTTNLASTNATKLGNLPLIIPSLSEQALILEFAKDISHKIATAISLKQQEIEKLKEYKATLINSAVTGKIKIA
jgi:type I restriction enzyme, S subunit